MFEYMDSLDARCMPFTVSWS